jgi:hypothetical protein
MFRLFEIPVTSHTSASTPGSVSTVLSSVLAEDKKVKTLVNPGPHLTSSERILTHKFAKANFHRGTDNNSSSLTTGAPFPWHSLSILLTLLT